MLQLPGSPGTRVLMRSNILRFGEVVAPAFCAGFRSLVATVIRCDVPVWLWPLWL